MSKNARKILLSAKDSFYIIFLKYFDYLFRAKGHTDPCGLLLCTKGGKSWQNRKRRRQQENQKKTR